jgi:hypothetical protein
MARRNTRVELAKGGEAAHTCGEKLKVVLALRAVLLLFAVLFRLSLPLSSARSRVACLARFAFRAIEQ